MRAVTLAAGAVVAAPMVLIVGGWVLWIQAHFGYLSMSTQTGFALANHSVGFIEFAPERYAPIRDIMLKYRAARLAAGKHPSNTIFDALPELQRTMGMTLPEVGREVQLMSTQTFQQQPLRYAGSVGMAWASFWAVDNYWVPQKISPRWLVRPLEALWWVEHKLLRASNLVFVLLGAASLIFTTARRRLRWGVDLTVASLVVILSSLVQALAEYGGNPRYGVTVQPLVVLIVMTLLWQLRTRPKPAPVLASSAA